MSVGRPAQHPKLIGRRKGSLVSTSGEAGTTAISAAEDSSRRRAVAVIGDENGYTGAASVAFTGLSSVSWLANRSVGSNVYQVVALNSGLCVAPAGDSTANTTGLVQVSCSTAGARTWRISVG